MAERNFYAYQIDFQKIGTIKGNRNLLSNIDFDTMTNLIYTKDILDRKQVNKGWFMLLDEIKVSLRKL